MPNSSMARRVSRSSRLRSLLNSTDDGAVRKIGWQPSSDGGLAGIGCATFMAWG
jgi:hypothetical protein